MRELFSKAYRVSRMHARYMARAYERYGERGPYVSAIGQDHFPDNVKNRLRMLARLVSVLLDQAWEARPKGMRKTTVFKIRDSVKLTEGKGFYG